MELMIQQFVQNGGTIQKLAPGINQEFRKYERLLLKKYWKVRGRSGKSAKNKADRIQALI